MEQTLMAVFENGLTPSLALSLLQILIVLFIVISIRNWMSNLVARRQAYRTLRSHKYLTEGCWVSLPTTTGTVDAQIIRITPLRVVLETNETFEHIPILQFFDSRKSILKVKPQTKEC